MVIWKNRHRLRFTLSRSDHFGQATAGDRHISSTPRVERGDPPTPPGPCGMMWIPYGRRSWDFLPKHPRHVGSPFGNTTTCLSKLQHTQTEYQLWWKHTIGDRDRSGMCGHVSIRNRCDSNMLSRKHLVYLLGRFYQATTSTHQRHLSIPTGGWTSMDFNPQKQGVSTAKSHVGAIPKGRGPWRAFFFSKSRHWKFPWRPTKKKPSRSWRRNAKRFFCIQTWRSNGLKNTVTWGYGEYHRIYHLLWYPIFRQTYQHHSNHVHEHTAYSHHP